MWEFMAKLLDTSDFPPRWHCGTWTAGHGWLHVISDLAIWAAYITIPFLLAYFVMRRKDVAFPRVFWLFCAFIFACGTVHLIEAAIFWWPAYRLSGVVKFITAAVSWATVVALIPIIPKALTMPGRAQFAEKLQEENAERKRTEDALADSLHALHEINDQLERRTDELARSNADLEQFAYVASHDLKEPLRAVSGYCQLLQMEYADQLDDEAQGYINHVVEGAERMQTLIDGLLAYSRVDRKGEPLHPTDTTQAVQAALKTLQASIEETGAVIRYDHLPTVTADETQLVHLFQNLISNAVKYHRDEPTEVSITAERQNGQWRFAVRDNGIGIRPEFRERIFAIFQRLHGRNEYAGTGIGLALCKRIVERHGGRIWVESEPGQGSVFYFTLPVGQQNHKGTETPCRNRYQVASDAVR